MKRWWLVIALLLSVGLNLGILTAILAARRQGPREPRPGAEMPNPGNDPLPRLPRLADRLGLEGEERRKFLEIQWNLYQETTRLRLQLGEVHRELRRELSGEEPGQARVDSLLNESARIYLALERALVRNVLATRELLGPEKEQEYLQMIGRLRVPGPGRVRPRTRARPRSQVSERPTPGPGESRPADEATPLGAAPKASPTATSEGAFRRRGKDSALTIPAPGGAVLASPGRKPWVAVRRLPGTSPGLTPWAGENRPARGWIASGPYSFSSDSASAVTFFAVFTA